MNIRFSKNGSETVNLFLLACFGLKSCFSKVQGAPLKKPLHLLMGLQNLLVRIVVMAGKCSPMRWEADRWSFGTFFAFYLVTILLCTSFVAVPGIHCD